MSPDAVLRCIIQTGGPDPDFFDGMLGSYREQQLLRILMQNDEDDDPDGYWRSWDVPWSEIVEVIRRERSTPVVGTNTRQADGTYARRGPYVQARLYKIGRGIECRLLDQDDEDMTQGRPYEWLKANIGDSGVRFSRDTQKNPQYGDDGKDELDGYALYAKERSEREVDEAAAKQALLLAPANVADLLAKRPEKVREYRSSQKFKDDLARRFSNVREKQGGIEPAHVEYVNRVIDLALAGAIPYRYCSMFFYANFGTSGFPASAELKADLAGVVRLMLQSLPYLESEKH
ncbi:MAG TPA: hypothetical protein VMH86_01620 [Rhizomicrobium sp.]|nr:hypothetical protein [Rhizomicrobium sp.]